MVGFFYKYNIHYFRGIYVKAAIFDLDGTLLDSMWLWKSLAHNYLKSIDIKPPDDLRETLKKLSLLEGCHYIKDRFQLSKTPEDINDEMEELLESHYANHFKLKPYVLETLKEFKNRNIRMCLATATADNLVAKALERLEIGDYFEFIQTSNNVGIGKSNPEFFQVVINRLDIEPKDIWVFEDALHCMISANKCGLKVVALQDDSAESDLEEIKKLADIYIEDLSKLDKQLY